MSNLSLLERLQGTDILWGSALEKELHQVGAENERLLMELNLQYRKNSEILELLEQITDKKIDRSTVICQPFYSDFGKHICFGKRNYVNKNVMFVDLGGITIEDDVMIGPGARLITVNHLIEPEARKGMKVDPVIVKKNAWIGANASILPGVVIGENSIVAADSTVTKSVPANVIVAGSPAKIIRSIDQN